MHRPVSLPGRFGGTDQISAGDDMRSRALCVCQEEIKLLCGFNVSGLPPPENKKAQNTARRSQSLDRLAYALTAVSDEVEHSGTTVSDPS